MQKNKIRKQPVLIRVKMPTASIIQPGVIYSFKSLPSSSHCEYKFCNKYPAPRVYTWTRQISSKRKICNWGFYLHIAYGMCCTDSRGPEKQEGVVEHERKYQCLIDTCYNNWGGDSLIKNFVWETLWNRIYYIMSSQAMFYRNLLLTVADTLPGSACQK